MHIKLVSGFLLTEVIIYMVLVSSIILMAMNFFVHVIFVLNNRNTEFNQITYTYAVLDMATRVLEHAPAFKHEYKYLAQDMLIWPDYENKRDMALQMTSNKLVLIKGKFDTNLHEWLHKRTTILLNNIEQCTLDCTEQKTVAGTVITSFIITLKLLNKMNEKDTQEIKKIVALNNVIYEVS